MSLNSSFIDTLITSLNYDYLMRNRIDVINIAKECLHHHNTNTHGKLLTKLCDLRLIDSDMVGELTKYDNTHLGMFPKHLIKPEHLLPAMWHSPMCIEKFHYLMTPRLVKDILDKKFTLLPRLPAEMISLDQVLEHFSSDWYGKVDLDIVKRFSMSEIMKIYEEYQGNYERVPWYDDNTHFLNDYFVNAELARTKQK